MSDFWRAWIDGISPERAELVRWFLVRMRAKDGIDETVTAMMAAIHILDLPSGKATADRLAVLEASRKRS